MKKKPLKLLGGTHKLSEHPMLTMGSSELATTPSHSRLAILSGGNRGIAQHEVPQLALLHAVAEFGGICGMVHLVGPGGDLRAIAQNGVPAAVTRPWQDVAANAPVAPAQAVRQNTAIWVSGTADSIVPHAGTAAVPVPGSGGAIGAISVVTPLREGPDESCWEFLRAVAVWLGEHMCTARLPVAPPVEQELGVEQVSQAVDVGYWEWDIQTGKLSWDEQTMAIHGVSPEDFKPHADTWTRLVHPDDLTGILAELNRAIHNRGFFYHECRICRPDGTIVWVQNRSRIVCDDTGEPVRLLGTSWDSTESRPVRDSVSRALPHMSDGFLSVDHAWRITSINHAAERFLGGPEQEVVGRTLWDAPVLEDLQELQAHCNRMTLGGPPMAVSLQRRDNKRWYSLRMVTVPDGLTVYVTDITEQRQREADRAEAQRAAAARSSCVHALTTALAEALTSRDVVNAVAHWVLPLFDATGLLIQTVEGDHTRTVGSAGCDDSLLEELDRIPLSEAEPISDALRKRTPLFISSPEEYRSLYPHIAHRPAKAGKKGWALLPLIASGNQIGICVIGFDEPRRVRDEERTLLVALSGLIGQALERARLYDTVQRRAQELQNGLLPRTLPVLPSVSAASRYLPAGHEGALGGDWYDVLPLSAHRVALVIGDVMGHGLNQAITMGRLRTAVRTLSELELPPAEILLHLSDLVRDLEEDTFVTCIYAVYDPIARSCTFACAGHPPPAILDTEGIVSFPSIPANPPLGVAEPPYDTADVVIPDGSVLVLYTDGLIESATHDLDDGMSRLARLLACGPHDLDSLCEFLTDGLLPADRPAGDDTAILATRMHGLADENVADWLLSESTQAAREARHHVNQKLHQWNLDDLTTNTELIASELVGNVIRHSKGPAHLRLLRSSTLVCEVSDHSPAAPHVRRASETDEGGRGLQLVAALCQRWGTRQTTDGKVIWTEQTID
ncbi:SpoIIE family protein phosphatase [Streptomyces sp. NPDC055709]